VHKNKKKRNFPVSRGGRPTRRDLNFKKKVHKRKRRKGHTGKRKATYPTRGGGKNLLERNANFPQEDCREEKGGVFASKSPPS